jgi:hypothetical protein
MIHCEIFVYQLQSDLAKVSYMFLWKTRISQKIKVFLWLVLKNRILSKENLNIRDWKGNTECIFCGFLKPQTTSSNAPLLCIPGE